MFPIKKFHLMNNLDKKGILIFSNLNKNSINRFKPYKKIQSYKTTVNEILSFAKENNLNILEIKSFSRLPDFLYDISTLKIYSYF